MMNAQIGTAIFTVAAVGLYQIFIKTVPANHNPILALVTFYVTALIVTLISAKLLPIDSPEWSLSGIAWPAVGVGVAIVGIELGYLLMYRSGWNLAAAPLIVMGGAALLLTPVSAFIFKQPWTLGNSLGIVLCLAGLYLLSPQQQ